MAVFFKSADICLSAVMLLVTSIPHLFIPTSCQTAHRWHILLIHQLAAVGGQTAGSGGGSGSPRAELAPLSSKHDDTKESASIITAGLIGASLPAPATKKTKRGRAKRKEEHKLWHDANLKLSNSWSTLYLLDYQWISRLLKCQKTVKNVTTSKNSHIPAAFIVWTNAQSSKIFSLLS